METNSPTTEETTTNETTNQETTNTEVTNDVTTEGTETEGKMYANKFKTVEDLEKSYTELQSTFSKKLGAFEGSPEEYTIPEDLANDPLYAGLAEWGKENQLSDEGLKGLHEGFVKANAEAEDFRIKAELQSLGKDSEQRLNTLSSYLDKAIGPEKANKLAESVTTAAGIEALEELMNKSQALGNPVDTDAVGTSTEDTVNKMRFATNEQGQRLISIDPTYRDKVLKAEEELLAKA